jgi:hypothetical protein
MHLIFVVLFFLAFCHIFIIYYCLLNTCKLHQWCNGYRADFECGRCMGNLIPDRIKPKTRTLVFVASQQIVSPLHNKLHKLTSLTKSLKLDYFGQNN